MLLTISISIWFQFTHPGKGATLDLRLLALAGLRFQFTHPGKGATGAWQSKKALVKFQFTHPGKGATVWCKVAYYRADKQA